MGSDGEGVTGFIAELTKCTFAGLATLDIGTQTYLTTEFLKFLLRAETDDFGVVYPFIIDVCKGLSTGIVFLTGGILRINCSELDFDRAVVCGDPIFISVQATTPFAQCLGKNGLTCDNFDPVYEPLALGSLRVLACLIYYTITTSPAEVGGQFGCDFVTIISRILGSSASKVLAPFLCTVQNTLMLDCAGITC
ncbi:uncharacterized protein [Dermacentor albipictus]|uniref:uncharacterized protein n=1 Tax=Dermacentor albipictus TaxID=60249 RepID=UPI0038FC2F41